MITERDQRIVKEWFEPYIHGSITNIEKSFFHGQQYSYEVARKRLLELSKAGILKSFRDIATNRIVYVLPDKNGKAKVPGWHRLITLDVLAEMRYCGFNVEEFELDKFWMGGKIRSDAFAIFTIKNRRYHFFIETQLSTHPHNLEKYDVLYENGEVQKYLGKNHFPRILFISDINYSDANTKHTEVLQLGTKLNVFPSILI